ncbi:MAG TPA: endonuclease/exonuclease/phosphatase family protein [Gillisia sp.]|nr:endonuclease/exonuclease/phosphatase family protein [Gillisia sp.]
MKGLKFIDKVLFLINSLLAFALLLSYLLPHIPPSNFPLLSVLSLGVPLLILGNVLFLLFWLLRLKRHFLLSLIILGAGYNYVIAWFQMGEKELSTEKELSVMSYNVRMFNAYKWVDDPKIPEKIQEFVNKQDPDILVTQEHYIGETKKFKEFPYNFIKLKDKGSEFGMAIFSKYPIVNKQSLDFPHNGNNNSIFVDIVKNGDTLRIFNVHFQSLNIKPGLQDIKDADSKQLIGRIGYGFNLQQNQAEIMMEEVNKSPHKTLVLGDFNNTAFSYIYRQVKGDRFQDAFLAAGSGFGRTFNLNYFPLRIDFLFIENSIPVNSFKVFPVDYSDHLPIMARINF